MRTVKLPSGAILTVAPAPFADAKALYQAVLRDLRSVSIGSGQDLQEMFKNFFCAGFASPEVERCLKPCLERCQYDSGNGNHKIGADTFEPIEARADYMRVLVEVAKENINPFAKSLFAEFKEALEMIELGQLFGSKTTTSSST